MRRSILVWGMMGLVILASTKAFCGAEAFERPSPNIAIQKSYVMDPPPVYQHCTDPGDSTQLTDGIYTQGYFWTQMSTVGWQNAKPVAITVDLNEDQAIRGVSLNTAAGAAGVAWPSAIFILTAGSDKQFHLAGELTALSRKNATPPKEGYAVHRYWTDALQTHGRYVALLLCNQPYGFVDEVEVYAGDPAWINQPLAGDSVSNPKDYVKRLSVYQGIQRRIRDDIQALRDKITQAALSYETRAPLLDELEALLRETDAMPLQEYPGLKAVLPLNPIHQNVYRVQARFWQASGFAPITLWTSGLWDPLSPTADPPRAAAPETAPAFQRNMMCNEYRALAFNLSNATAEDTTVTVNFSGIPGSPVPAWAAVHEVAWTDTASGTPVAAALPRAEQRGDGYLIHLPSGLTRQVWITFHPVDIPAQDIAGEIRIQSPQFQAAMPLQITLFPMRFPEHPTLHFGGWDYTNEPKMYEATEENKLPLIKLLQEYFVDSPWATSSALPFGEYDAAGTMTQPPDTANFDHWIKLWPDAGQYLVFPAVGARLKSWNAGAPEFDRAVQEWARFWAGHAKQQGIDPGRIGLLLVDEPSSAEQDATILAWAKALRQADTGLRVWEDPIYQDMAKANPDTIAACHVLCPNRPIFLHAPQEYRDFFIAQRDRGIALDFYSCSGPVRLLDPYRYFLLQAWTCWQYRAQSSYFWAFADGAGAPSWNEYLTERAAFTPLFIDATSVTPGKHLEAAREGIEDYEYFVMLQKVLDSPKSAQLDPQLRQQAQYLLNDAPAQLLADADTSLFQWTPVPKTSPSIEKIRADILHILAVFGQ